MGKKIALGVLLVLLAGGGYAFWKIPVKHVEGPLTANVEKAAKSVGRMPTEATEKTKTHCYMTCGDVPFDRFRCVMVCATCTDEFGGGCGLSVYY